MGVKGTCRSANGGGWLFLPTLYISSRHSFASASGLLRHSTRSKGHLIRAKSGKSKHLFSCVCVFSGISETKKGKSEIYFGFGGCRGFRCSSPFVAVVVSTECRWCAPAPSLWVCSVPLPCLLSAFLLCLWCIAFEYGFISRFKGVFSAFWGADVYLYGLRSLR